MEPRDRAQSSPCSPWARHSQLSLALRITLASACSRFATDRLVHLDAHRSGAAKFRSRRGASRGTTEILWRDLDAAGALFGKRYGQAEYNTLEGRKSAEGSACVFLAAYFSVHLPLAFLAPEIGKPEAILLALCVAILVMIVEGFSGYGLDNFIAPVFSGFLLYRLHDRAAPEMAAMVAVLAGLLMIGTCFRKRGTLDGGAILGGVLLAFSGYAVFSWVGLLIVLGPYLNHLFAAAPFLKELGPVHDLRSVLGVAITAAFWLILGLFFDEILPWLIPFAVGFAVHLGLLNRITQRATSPHGRSLVRVLRAALKGTVICLLPLLFVEQIRPLLLGIVPATFILTLLAGAWMEIFVRAERDENPVPWIAHALLGTIASSLTLFLVFGDELIAYFNFK